MVPLEMTTCLRRKHESRELRCSVWAGAREHRAALQGVRQLSGPCLTNLPWHWRLLTLCQHTVTSCRGTSCSAAPGGNESDV